MKSRSFVDKTLIPMPILCQKGPECQTKEHQDNYNIAFNDKIDFALIYCFFKIIFNSSNCNPLSNTVAPNGKGVKVEPSIYKQYNWFLTKYSSNGPTCMCRIS